MREAMTNPSLADFAVTTLDGQPLNLADLTGRVLLIVNTASECGFTPQYAGQQALHERYGAQGLTGLGFPCNQFGAQEPGDAEQIGAFCQRNYGVGFPMMAKVDVNGAHAAPLFRWLKEQAPGLLPMIRRNRIRPWPDARSRSPAGREWPASRCGG